MFAEFLEVHGQEKVLEEIKEEDKVEEPLAKEKSDDEHINKIANADISDFEVYNFIFLYKLCI